MVKEEDIKINCEVLLSWNGMYHVPMWLNQTWATVLEKTKQGLYLVQPIQDTGTRKITLANICAVRYKTENLSH
jgi:hypothetical protein